MKPKIWSLWLLPVLALLTASLLLEAKPNTGTFTLYKRIKLGSVTVEIFRGPKNLAVPDLCNGSINAEPISGYTGFTVSNNAAITISVTYDNCTEHTCCNTTPPSCGNAFGWGEDPTTSITYPLKEWDDCEPFNRPYTSPLDLPCMDANETWYFKATVNDSYDCPNTVVTISADCNSASCP